MVTLALFLLLLSFFIFLAAGLVLTVKLAIYALVAYALWKLIEWLFD